MVKRCTKKFSIYYSILFYIYFYFVLRWTILWVLRTISFDLKKLRVWLDLPAGPGPPDREVDRLSVEYVTDLHWETRMEVSSNTKQSVLQHINIDVELLDTFYLAHNLETILNYNNHYIRWKNLRVNIVMIHGN